MAGTFNHLDTTERDDGALERLVGLQADDLFQTVFDVTSIVRGNGGGYVGVKINRRMGTVLFLDAFHDLVPQSRGGLGSASEEALVAFVRGVVLLNEVAGIDFSLPSSGYEAFPCLQTLFVKLCHVSLPLRY